jgi:hypothetical protein
MLSGFSVIAPVLTPFAVDISIPPNGGNLPGSDALEKLVGGLMFWGLIACVAGTIISAGAWALSNRTGNYQHSSAGKAGFVACGVGALVIGAAGAFVEFLYNTGSHVHP